MGNLGSKVISLILVPLYTYYLSTTEYGVVDLVTTTGTMILPIVSSSIYESVLRFTMDQKQKSDRILTNSIVIATIGFFIFMAFYPVFVYFNIFESYLNYLYLLVLVQLFERIFAQYARAIGEVKIFAINGVLLTFSTGIMNILFLVYFNLGIRGYFTSLVISNVISLVYLLIATKAYKKISFKLFNKSFSKELFGYALPMVPNSLMWWLINASSRYFIGFFVGISANGLFAVASKIPSLINMINQVFNQAWQLSAIEEYESENKSLFYSTVFFSLSSVMFLGTSVIIILVKVLFANILSIEYYNAWKVVPFLVLGAVFSCFSGFLGTNYIAAKETKGVFKTSVYGGVISLALNLAFIPSFGIVGAGISSMLSFFAMFYIRVLDTKKYIELKIDWRHFFGNLSIIFMQIFILTINMSLFYESIIEITLLFILLILNKKMLKQFMNIFQFSKLLNND